MKKKIIWTTANKLIVILLFMFAISCLRLCAESMTPAEAQVAREKFVEAIKKQVGKPYVYGAVGPDSFDCSGLVFYTARESVKIQLPRTAKAIYSYARIVPDDQRELGDLLFFTTNSAGTINHVGVYIGNNQFISAISDGENTGVIVSSLNQNYWKGKYRATGQFLPSGKSKNSKESPQNKEASNQDDFIEVEAVEGEDTTKLFEDSGSSQKIKTDSSNKNTSEYSNEEENSFGQRLVKNVVFDGNVGMDWILFSANQVAFKYRGIDLLLNARYSGWKYEPGVGLLFRFNYGLSNFQIPVIFSITPNDYLRFYAGPVFSFGKAMLPDDSVEIKPSILPGIVGACFSTPALSIGKFKFQLEQDINYSVCNELDGSALSIGKSLIAGLVTTTGIRVTFPLSMFF